MQLDIKKNDIERANAIIQNAKKKQERKKQSLKKQERKRSMSSTPLLRGHHPKSYAMNAYLTKGLSK
jgi:hypothetical protein